MGWVTLTLRRKELTAAHASYQMRELELGRQQRSVHRKYAALQSEIKADAKQQLAGLREAYQSERSAAMGKMESLIAQMKTEEAGTGDGSTGAVKQSTSSEWALIQQELAEAQEKYQFAKAGVEEYKEEEIAMYEEMANEEETDIELEKTDVEAQMEAIAQELQVVKDSISQDIQNSTISLK